MKQCPVCNGWSVDEFKHGEVCLTYGCSYKKRYLTLEERVIILERRVEGLVKLAEGEG